MLRQQWQVIALSSLACLLWLMPLTFGPYIFGRAVDDGILGGSTADLLTWAGVMLGVVVVGGVFGVVFHTLVVRSWLISLYGTTQMVTRKIAQMGHVLPRRSPTGEVLSVASSDSDEFGALTEILARSAAQLVSYLTVAAIVLSMSWQLGVLVLVAAPVLLGAALPLLRPLHRRQQVERSRNSELTSMATDIVAGLRILRGIGGEETFGRNYADQSQPARRAGVSSGIWQAAVEAVGVLFSGVFLVSLVWLGTRQVNAGELSVGQLVSFLGYGLFMVGPIRTFFELAQKSTRALVSARRAIAIFEQRPPWREPAEPRPLDGRAEIVDDLSGFTAHPGLLTVVVSAVPEQSAALADRLGRYLPPDTDPVGEDDGDGPQGPRGPPGPGRPRAPPRPHRRARRGGRDPRVGRAARWRRPVGGAPRRRTPPGAGQRHRQRPVRRHPPGRHRPARPADPRAGRGRRCASPTPRTSTTRCRRAGRASSTSAVAGSPAASGSAWCWPARSPSTRRSWCWSSRPPPSTPTPRPASPSG